MTVSEGASVGRWRPYIGPVVLAVLFAGTGGLLVVWLRTVDAGTLRDQLVRWQFWVLEAQFVLLVALSWRHLPGCVRSVTIPPRVGIAVLVASLTALVLSTAVAPHTNRIYYDEHIYQGIGHNLPDLHLAQMCNEGTVEYGHLQCWRGEYNKQPYGYSYLLSVAYRLFGANDWIAHEMNAVTAALLVWVVFLLASGLFDSVRVGAYAGLVAALIPQQLLWSHTAASEPTATLTVAFAILTAVHAARVGSLSSLLWVASATAFAMQFRTESILVLPVVAAVLALRGRGTVRAVPVGWAVLLGLVLCGVYAGHVFAVRNDAWGAPADRMSFEFFWANLEVNGGFFLGDSRFPLLYTVLALLGVIMHGGRGVVVAGLYFLCFWGVFLFFYAGSYNYGADIRFSLMSYPAVAILAGAGASALHDLATRISAQTRHVAAGICAVLCIHFLWYLPQVRASGEEAWAARADVDFVQDVTRTLPRNSFVLTHNPSMFLLRGVNAGQMSLANNDPQYVHSNLAARYAGGVYLHWNFWCNVGDPVQQSFCVHVRDQFEHSLVQEVQERTYRYALYRLDVGQR